MWGLVAIGIVIRIVRYAADRSLWGDESALALNILQRSPRELFEPLDYLQGAPTGFLLAEKAVTHVLGDDELSLRLVPLICGVAALVVFALVARRILQTEAAVLAVALVAFSDPLVYYSSEVKQYEPDVLAAVLLLYGAVAVDWARVRFVSGAALGLAGASVVWFSHAALLILPSLLAVLIVSAWLRRARAELRVLISLGLVWGVSAIGAFALNRENTEAVADAALGATGSTGQGVREPFAKAWDAYAEVVGVANTATALAALAAVAGLLVLWRRNPWHATLVVAPGIAAFLAGALGRYPFSDRFILFIAPALILVTAEGAVALVGALPRGLRPAGVAALVLLLAYPVVLSAKRALDPPGHEEVKSVLRVMEREWRPGDALHVWYQSQYPFRYYAECEDCDVLAPDGPASVVWPPDSRELAAQNALATHEPGLYLSSSSHNPATYAPSLARLDGRSRVWFLFSSSWDDVLVRHVLDCMGRLQREVRETRAVAYLYDLAAPPESSSCAG